MSLLLGMAILALAVLAGGLAAMRREPTHAIMLLVRTFAVVAAASVALLHLLPEAVGEVGPAAVLVALLGAVVPAVLERVITPHKDIAHTAPTTALAMGYAAVIAHQAGEGAALASLARTGALTVAIVLAIAAHTVPLAMVVAIRVIEAKGERGAKGATSIALGGVIVATIGGAAAGNLVATARLVQFQPWILALVAGLLLHALSHDVLASGATTTRAKVGDAAAGLFGLGLALLGLEEGSWIHTAPAPLRAAAVFGVALAIVMRSFSNRKPHDHAHRHHHH